MPATSCQVCAARVRRGGGGGGGNESERLTAGERRSRCPSIFSSRTGGGGRGRGNVVARSPGDSHSAAVKLARPPEAGGGKGGSCGTFTARLFLWQLVGFLKRN